MHNSLFRPVWFAAALFALLLLSACGGSRQASPANTVDVQAVSSTVPEDGALGVAADSTITLTFSEAADRSVLEQGFTLYTGNYDRASNPTQFVPLALTFICNGTWKVTNPNDAAVSFEWNTDKGTEQGVGVVEENSSALFYSVTNGNKVNLYVGGAVQDVEQSYQEPCNQPRGAFTWSGDSSSVIYTSLALFEADTDYTVVLSTAVQGLEEPYVLRFSTKLPGNWQQTTLGGSGFTSYDAASETFTLSVSGGTQLFSQTISSGEAQLFEACLELQSDDPAAKAAIVLYQGIEDSQYQNPWIEVAKTSGGTVVTAVDSAGTETTLNGSLAEPDCYRIVIDGGAVTIYEGELPDTAPLSAKIAATAGVVTTAATPVEYSLVGSSSAAPTPPYSIGVSASSPTDATVNANNVQQTQLAPLTAAFTATPEDGSSPLEVEFDASGSTGTGLSYSWDFDLDDNNDGTPDPLSEDASGLSVTHSFDFDGSYTVTLSVTDAGGRQAQTTKDIEVSSSVDPEDDPNTETVEASPSLEVGLAFGGDEFVFDAYGSSGTGLTYDWNFGDGTSATGPYIVKSYGDPGVYTVELTITNSVNRTDTLRREVVVLPEPFEIPSTRALKANGGNKTLSFDLGEPVPGISYEVDFGDGNTYAGPGGEINHSYDELGTYTVNYKVTDSRDPEADPQVFEEETWLTVWDSAPEAEFTLSSFYGVAPHSVTFNAGASQGSGSLRYNWDFGDGATASGVTTQHSFEEGFWPVTLTVTDENELSDSYTAFVKAKTEGSDVRILVEYPAQTSNLQALRADTFDLEEFLTGNPPPWASDTSGVTESRVGPATVEENIYYDWFPYVIQQDAKLKAVSAFTRISFCNLLKAYFTYPGGLVETPNVFKGNNNNFGDTTFCNFMRFNVGGPSFPDPLTDRADSHIYIQESSGRQYFYYFDIIAGVRVPKVFVNIVPDEMVPGGEASPYVIEQSAVRESDGKELMMLNVLVRESEVDNGNISFDVPVYAVDEQGRLLSGANGYFYADFPGVGFDDCGDCVMVDGKAHITVEMPVNANTVLDLDTLELYRYGDCGDPGLDGAYTYLRGCQTLETSPEVPLNAPPMMQFAYPVPASVFEEANRVKFGIAETDREIMRLQTQARGYTVAIETLRFISVYDDSKTVLRELENAVQGDEVNYADASFAVLGIGFEVVGGKVVDLLGTAVRASLKAAKGGGSKLIAEAVEDTARQAAREGEDAAGFVTHLDEKYSGLVKLAEECGERCLLSAERIAKQIADETGQLADDVLAEIDSAVKLLQDAESDPKLFFQTVDNLSQLPCTAISAASLSTNALENCAKRVYEQVKRSMSIIDVSRRSTNPATKLNFSPDEFNVALNIVCCRLKVDGANRWFVDFEDAADSELLAKIKKVYAEALTVNKNLIRNMKPVQMERTFTIGSDKIEADIISKVLGSGSSHPNVDYVIDEVKGGLSSFTTNQLSKLVRNSNQLCDKLSNFGINDCVRAGARLVIHDFAGRYSSGREFVGNFLDGRIGRSACVAAEQANVYIVFAINGPNGFLQHSKVQCSWFTVP